MKRLKIYIAGFECFLPDSEKLAQDSIEICAKYGFIGLSPASSNKPVDFSKGKRYAAHNIFQNNIELIDECDVVIANLNNFRGWEPDSGTCFEMGYAYTKGKMLYGFMDDTAPCYEKYIGSIHNDGVFWRDDNGAFFESGACNLMLSGMAEIVEGNFETAVQKLYRDIEEK